jgi:hypothetical protein
MKFELMQELSGARDTITELVRIFSRNKYRGDLGTVLVAGLLTALIQYHRSIILLSNSGSVRAAVALAREVVGGMYTALWIHGCASPDQISKVETDDKLPLTYAEIVEQVDSRYKENTFFVDMKNLSCIPLCSYVWPGIVQLGLWSLGSEAHLPHEEDLVTRVSSTATLCILFLASEFLANQDQAEESKAVQVLTDDYQKRRASRPLFFHKSA